MWWFRSKSASKAKDRLKLVLAYDRAQVAPGLVDELKRDLMAVLKKYFPDETGLEVGVEHLGEHMVMRADIPLKDGR